MDFRLQGRGIPMSELEDLDAQMSGRVQQSTTGKGISRPVFPIIWKNRGLSLPIFQTE
jgi:hypothetical protein